MARYFIYLSYDGTRYHGWQIQPNGTSIQQTLQQSLSTLLRTHTPVVGAGRTDAGVHARLMTAHFDTPDDHLDRPLLVRKLNSILPPDIAISHIRPVVPEAHARFDATSRTYHYHMHFFKSPFLTNRSCRMFSALDFDKINAAAALLPTFTDFTSFSKTHTDVKTSICHISTARFVNHAPGEYHFSITADRFLRNMVRAIVGTLVEVGRGHLTTEQFVHIVRSRNRSMAGQSMPAHGLYLVDITYPENLFTD